MYIDFNGIYVAGGIISSFGVLIDFFDISEIRQATDEEKHQYYLINGY